jgi:hypothetical protein
MMPLCVMTASRYYSILDFLDNSPIHLLLVARFSFDKGARRYFPEKRRSGEPIIVF